MRIAIANDNDANLIILKHIIEKLTKHEIAWTAVDGLDAIEKCKQDTPDIILMDMIMPGINGVEACGVIMKETPCAILIVTASVTGNAAMVFEAMSFGALDVVQTPFSGIKDSKKDIDNFLRKINIAQSLVKSNSEKNGKQAPPPVITSKSKNGAIVVLGSSTGGPGVLATILKKLPADFPVPVIIVQHVDSSFTKSFASWLNKQSSLEVRLACCGEKPQAGTVLIAGESNHLIMQKGQKLAYSEELKELIYKPSVDVFFDSVVRHWKGAIVAALLTGMGKDGAQGLASIHKKGGHTITQNKATCAVYGMPKAADDLGASTQSLPPEEIADSIISIIYGQ